MQKYLYKVKINNKKLNITEEFEFNSYNSNITKKDFLDWNSFTIINNPNNQRVLMFNIKDRQTVDRIYEMLEYSQSIIDSPRIIKSIFN